MNPPDAEDALAQAERHVREGEERIGRQIALIEKLDGGGHETDTAQQLLDLFQDVLELWRVALVRIRGRMEVNRVS